MAVLTYEQLGARMIGSEAMLIKIDSATTGDTIPITDFSSVLAFLAVKASDMTTTIAGTISGATITITGTIAAGPLVALVTGVRKYT
jgi:hypothetical protein